MKKFNGKVIVVTGATSGIGKAAATMFANLGGQVVCIARHPSLQFESFIADVSDEGQVTSAIGQVLAKYGKIDVLVNNAGFGISGAVEDTPLSAAHSIFEVNFFGAFNVIRAVLPAMRQAGGGTIINVSSVAAELAIPFQSFYSASKAALSSLSSSLRCEVAPFGIKVTSVLPGDVKTGFTAARKKSPKGSAYGERAERAVATMERDEVGGMSPDVIARDIVRLAARRNPPVCKVGGKKYALLVRLSKLLPSRLVNYILGKMYG